MALPAEDLFSGRKTAETVGQLTRRIKRLLEDSIRTVAVTGEISNWRPNPSGHVYFILKDEEAQLPCALWRSNATKLKFQPENGMQVVAHGRLEVYPPHGKYQLSVDRMEPAGLGALQLQFEQLKKRLEAEGLFDPARKRPLPPYPATVAIVTSPTGAALQDMLRILNTRWPRLHVLVYPAKVQGEGSALEIAAAIAQLNEARPDVDVMIVGRGGGSIEDLWAFNEEPVARAIFASRIPVVSAVGHEIDFTIADFVADLRAATPTDAATKVVPEYAAVVGMVDDLAAKLGRSLRERAKLARATLDGLSDSHALRSPETLVRHQQQRLDELTARLRTGLEGAAADARRILDQSERSARLAIGNTLERSKQRLDGARSHLEAVNPLAVLKRGYSVTLDESGKVVTDPAQVKPGQAIRSRVHKGEFRSRVE